MKLPNQNSNSQKGQILIIFLLVLVVGLAIALSIASRSVTDVRQTTTSDESNRAYFAAEAGVQNALKLIEDKTISDASIALGGGQDIQAKLDLKTTNRSSADVTVTNLSIDAGEVFEYPSTLAKDDVGQINLMSNFYDITKAGVNDVTTDFKGLQRTDTLDIYWDQGGSGRPAIEVSIVTCTAPCTTGAAQVFNIYKMVFDPNGSTRPSNFCTSNIAGGSPGTITNLTPSPGIDFRFKVSLKLDTLNTGTNCSTNDTVLPGQAPVLARIRMLYEGPIKVAVGNSANRLPNQGFQVESLGIVGSGVARKLLVNRLYPALPSVFDYVLYNGSTTNPLSKP